MHPLLAERRNDLIDLCLKYHVRQLELFGSAAALGEADEPGDLDFLVEFSRVDSMSLADQYFGLLRELEELFHRDIDLLTPASIRNPYFRRAIDESRLPLYAA